ncbi:hypothetical protein [Neosynechococcus sphagnicola]|uniref:amino acid kinase family protein n=1 Tax=Neosynechococcus sphagnicola TaxID=1501145 RepID=UPI0030842DC3
MALIVQKYGGSSVGTVERIQAVAQRVQRTVAAGNSVVVVVSAMGKTTDGLVTLAHAISDSPSRREMDMLLSTGGAGDHCPVEYGVAESRPACDFPDGSPSGNCHRSRTYPCPDFAH